jgi:HD-GYP domain-containing protein (c-di-GMP phosphodiesterase class II)
MPAEVAVERMRDLAGNVLDEQVYKALETAVRKRQTLTFLDDPRS